MTTSARDSDAGASALVDRLAEIQLIPIIRSYATNTEGGRGFIAALSNEAIGRLIGAIHQAPGQSWSVGSMASTAGMSRSVLTSASSA